MPPPVCCSASACSCPRAIRAGNAISAGAAGARDADTVAAALAAQGLGARPARVIASDPATLAVAAALAGPRATLTVYAPRPVADLSGALVAREVTVLGVAGAHPDLVVE